MRQLLANVRPFVACDLDAVLSIQADCSQAASWSRADYERFCLSRSPAESDGQVPGWVAEREGAILGFLIARQVADELEVLNLGVAPAHRRAGIGSLLLEHALTHARRSGARRAYLEVRASNEAGIAFYKRHGFAFAGRRARYYSNPVEDALVLCREV